MVLDHLTPLQRRAYILADNKIAECAGWDTDLLASELRALEEADLNLEMLGFSEKELETFLQDWPQTHHEDIDQRDENPQQEEIPSPPAHPVTLPGDIWILGSHKVICGDARNPRVHDAAQVTQIAASMMEFGWTQPILVDGNNGVIAGHGRLMAARQLGLAKVPVIELSHLSETQKRAYIIADNQLTINASWDDEMLRVELDSLREAEFDISLTGIDDTALQTLMSNEETTVEGRTDEDAVPDTQPVCVSRPGDIWLMGQHRVLCGDATDASSYSVLLEGEQADMIFTDPPYNVAYTGAAGSIQNDDLGAEFHDFLLAALVPMLAHCRGGVYVAMSSSELDALQAAFRAAGGHWSTFIIWAKDRFTLGRSDYQRQYEPILYGWREGVARHWCGDRDQGDVWFIKKPIRNDLHPTMKPVELVERALRNSSRPGDVVLDSFGGSGTTLIAAEKAGRQARLIELEPKFVDVVIRRWQEFSGDKAIRQSDGMVFAA